MSLHPTFSEISEIVAGKLALFSTNIVIEHISIDSRTIYSPTNTCFFAIIGERKNGTHFIGDAYKRGVRFFIVEQKVNYSDYPNASFITVKNTITALQELVANYRSKFNIPIIGVTGSNGKTIIKEWLFQLLAKNKSVVRNPKSYNSQVGVPLSVWNISVTNEIGIFEAGISKPNEMENLAKIIRPTIGVLTNIGDAHGENFESKNQKLQEKIRLFKNSEIIITCNEPEIVTQIKKTYPQKTLLTWGEKTADLQVTAINDYDVELVWNNKKTTISLPFNDNSSVKNCFTCILTLLYLGYSFKKIQSRITKLTRVAMRLELKEGINGCSIINDSFNSDFTSLSIALDFLNQQNQHPSKTLILSDILQSDLPSNELYPAIAQLIKDKGVTRFIGIGKNMQTYKNKFIANSSFYNSTERFLNHLPKFENETILLKGAREFRFEEINRQLQQKQHETVLEINLNALINNYNYFKSLLKPTTKIMVMVKAYSYGSGSFEIANALQHNQVDYLAVAYADEGVELRKAGISLPIMVMNPEENSFELLTEHHLEPEIYCIRILDAFKTYLKNKQIQHFPIHLKIDTGMNRLGFNVDELPHVLTKIKSKYLKLISVFSHLVGADEPEHDSFTKKQISDFKNSCNLLESELGHPVIKHILNSNGIVRFTKHQEDMVRLGIGIYGIVVPNEHKKNLEPVYSLKTTISQIKQIKKGETIGYSRKGIAHKTTTIATLPIGYADGINRKLGNGNISFMVSGKQYKTIGNICMDMCMLDVTNSNLQEGDTVIVFGKDLAIQNISDALETIPYEVLTGISRRVKRVYFQE